MRNYVVTAVHHVTVNEDRCRAWGLDPELAIREELGFRRAAGILVTLERATVTDITPVEAPGVPACV